MSKISRREFLKLSGILGVTLYLPLVHTACNINDDSTEFTGSVLIIGAGAAGMAAGHLLAQQGIDFQILEAAATYGGRMKRTTTFANFPIPLGAEWLHVEETEFGDIVNDPSVQITINMQEYSIDDTEGHYEDGELTIESPDNPDTDKKFINATWFDFFDEYIVPNIRSKMRFNTQIVVVDYQNDKVILTDSNGQTYEADKVIVTAPLKILQDGDIDFIPPLPEDKAEAIEEANVWGGMKVFLEFSEKFYPTYLSFADSDTNTGQRLYYDAAYGQQTSANILGLFAVGEQAEQYQALSGDALRDFILDELDEVFDGIPSQTYVKHMAQNWNEEPFIRAAYLADVASYRTSRTLSESIEQKLFFAGEAYTQEDDWGGVHNAARSARDAVQELLG